MPGAVEDTRFTMEAARQIATKFGIVGREEALHLLIARTTKNYENYKLDPNFHQRKDALGKLSRALHEVERVSSRRHRALTLPLYDTAMRKLGEFLTYEALEELT